MTQSVEIIILHQRVNVLFRDVCRPLRIREDVRCSVLTYSTSDLRFVVVLQAPWFTLGKWIGCRWVSTLTFSAISVCTSARRAEVWLINSRFEWQLRGVSEAWLLSFLCGPLALFYSIKTDIMSNSSARTATNSLFHEERLLYLLWPIIYNFHLNSLNIQRTIAAHSTVWFEREWFFWTSSFLGNHKHRAQSM